MSFLSSYFNLIEGGGENPVCCPFPHTLPDGTEYLESRPSAHVNTTKNLFHCKACDRRYNDQQFLKVITGCSDVDAYELERLFNNENNYSAFEWEAERNLSEAHYEKARELGISDEVIKELQLKNGDVSDIAIAFPAIVFDRVVDIRQYNPGGKPKLRSATGAKSGMVIPFNIWIESPKHKTTLICAGEKDMALARTHGFNAITITGGEKSIPKFLNYFKDRKVAIVYDNDQAGKTGALKLAESLYPYTKDIKVVTNFHEVCTEIGEDITDFFMKYKKTRADLIKYIKDTDLFFPDVQSRKEEEHKNYPIVDLYEASQNHVGQLVRSNIQVVATSETAFQTPAELVAIKKKESEGVVNTMVKGETISWNLTDNNSQEILYLIDSALKEKQIIDNMRTNIFKKPSERNLEMKITKEVTTYKLSVTDLFETADKNVQPMEYTAYSIGNKLESGKKYLITYKLVPHPYKGQQLVMIIVNARQASDSISNFTISQSVVDNLKQIQGLGATVAERVDKLVEMNKAFVGYDGINNLIKTIDLSFNTPLRFNFGRSENIRAYLDTLIVGESRTGKSSTADALRKLYGLGTFTSLAGNSATIAGLVGGSSKTASGSMQTRAGVIPQNHMGLIIFEEFGKSSKDVLKELTDIRSSNEVRIARVTGTTTLPALVRMIALTNVKTTNNEIKSIASYPNGIAIVTELVNTAEDIARYDNILILADSGQKDINPLWEPEPPLEEQVYKDRIRWIWTRTAEQIEISKDLQKRIVEESNRLNNLYPSHIKLFGTEAWKKIARVAIAVAGYTVSTNDTFDKIIVTEECIDYAVQYLTSLYDNNTFKFKEYVDMELRYKRTDNEAVASLQNIYNKYPSLVLQLEQQVEITRAMLESTTGLENQELRKGLQLLVKSYFIKVENTTINPTERFRTTLNQINKNTQIGRVGEL